MAKPWLRLYRDAINKPKFGRLDMEGRGFWVSCLMMSDDTGLLPPAPDMQWVLRTDIVYVEAMLASLERHGLVTRDSHDGVTVYRLHDWDEHQHASDADPTARERKQRQREREKAQKSAVTRDVTHGHGNSHASVTRTDTDTDTDTEKRESNARENNRPANRSRTPWPPDAVVPDQWITTAAQQRRLAGLPEIDLHVAARMFANHYAADAQNPRTMTEYQAKWNNWALKEKAANGTRSGAKSQLDQIADIIAADQVING